MSITKITIWSSLAIVAVAATTVTLLSSEEKTNMPSLLEQKTNALMSVREKTLINKARENMHSITLAWNNSHGTNIAGYKVYYGVDSRNYTNSINVGNKTHCTIGGLDLQKNTYYFSVTSYTDTGLESDYSVEMKY